MKKYALFLGCTTPTRVIQYEVSTRWVARRLGIELVDIEDFSCCGSNHINLSLEAGLLLAARNLALAEARGLDIITVCGGCTGVLSEAIEELREEGIRAKVNKRLGCLGLDYNGTVRVKHFSRFLYEDIGLDLLKKEIKRDLSGLKTAPHYGCHYLKPKAVYEGFDEPENPKTLHQLIAVTGALSIEYETLLLCCGGKTFPNGPDISLSLISTKLDNLSSKGIDCLTLHCNSCYLMYGPQQLKTTETLGKHYDIPILLYPQLLGLGLGADPAKDLGLDLNIPGNLNPLLKKVNINENWRTLSGR